MRDSVPRQSRQSNIANHLPKAISTYFISYGAGFKMPVISYLIKLNHIGLTVHQSNTNLPNLYKDANMY